ncbi:MAG: 1-aminocyclopropane-1-carboxylate deaminase/D-cysteine desulfhydrase [Bacteroidetes bacterium]|nr:1-aminocyclopropane-1-carboxylate deaminase/D-cysteine desulfhydrase [Bacteroidota bacterium]
MNHPRIDKIIINEQEISILRLDLPDPVSGGNKFFKLKYNLEEMKRCGKKKLLTFGGAYSNLIAAVSVAGNKNGIETVGIIRGEELKEDSNAVLKYASSNGMQLHFISRKEYRKRNEEKYSDELRKKFRADVILPEGGSNALAVKGCMEILSDETHFADVIFCAVGTGATLAGIIASAKKHQCVNGIAVLEGKNYLEQEVQKFINGKEVKCKWRIDHDHSFGGYAKTDQRLMNFIAEWKHQLPLDPVYSGKCFFAVSQFVQRKNSARKNVLFIHTGGYGFLNSPMKST